jgi:hypothetical protein
LVPRVGVEPTRPYGQRILSPMKAPSPGLTKRYQPVFIGLAVVKVSLRRVVPYFGFAFGWRKKRSTKLQEAGLALFAPFVFFVDRSCSKQENQENQIKSLPFVWLRINTSSHHLSPILLTKVPRRSSWDTDHGRTSCTALSSAARRCLSDGTSPRWKSGCMVRACCNADS